MTVLSKTKYKFLQLSIVFLGITQANSQEIIDLPIDQKKTIATLSPVPFQTSHVVSVKTPVIPTPAPATEVGNKTAGVQNEESSMPPLIISAGDRLSSSLEAWLKSQDIRISWESTGALPGRVRDVSIESSWESSGENIEEVLQEVLQPFGFEATLLKTKAIPPKIISVVIKNSKPTRP